jgi:glycosyltransferase involved in cell wall biosynthesis
MRAALEAADAVVMNTPEAARRVREHFPAVGDKPVVSITNGFDPADFAGPTPRRDDGAFRIVHTGYLHTADGLRLRKVRRLRRLLGGTFTDVDILTRSHVYLLQAIDRLLADDPSLASTLELHLAGVLTPADREAAAGSRVVRMPGYVGHSESVALVRSADLLFLPMHDLPPGVRAGLVPGKTYEYLASGRPILAAVPEGDARDLLREGGSAFIASPADVGAMAKILADQLERWRRGEPAPPARPEVVARYERPAQALQLAALFSDLLGR